MNDADLNSIKCTYDLWNDPEILTYDIVSIDETGTESPYGTMELHTRREGNTLLMNDSITLDPQYRSMKFARTLSYKDSDLLHPIDVTLDISAESKSNREMSYSKGIFSVYGQDPVAVDFSQGILVYNATLRIVRLLDMNQPHRYTFRMYAEPFLFRIREASEDEVYYLESKPVSNSDPYISNKGNYVRMQAGTITTEIWVDQERKPIRLIENLKENLNVIFKLRQ